MFSKIKESAKFFILGYLGMLKTSKENFLEKRGEKKTPKAKQLIDLNNPNINVSLGKIISSSTLLVSRLLSFFRNH